MELNLLHLKEIADNNINVNDLPSNIKLALNRLKGSITRYDNKPSVKMKESIEKTSANIGHDIMDWYEKDLPEEEDNISTETVNQDDKNEETVLDSLENENNTVATEVSSTNNDVPVNEVVDNDDNGKEKKTEENENLEFENKSEEEKELEIKETIRKTKEEIQKNNTPNQVDLSEKNKIEEQDRREILSREKRAFDRHNSYRNVQNNNIQKNQAETVEEESNTPSKHPNLIELEAKKQEEELQKKQAETKPTTKSSGSINLFDFIFGL
jgi:hypothetical protein